MDKEQSRIIDHAKNWSEQDCFDTNTRKQVGDLLVKDAFDELSEMFYKELEFGTGGMRGVVGPGTARMNIYNIRKASSAVAQAMIAEFGEGGKVAISYDSRIHSVEFSKAAAEVFAAHGLTVYRTKALRPTPILSFAVRHFGCQGGVCITASHNPPEYNGYKVYWQHGGQVTPPYDKNIIEIYNAMNSYNKIPVGSYEDFLASGKIIEVSEELDAAYFEKLATLVSPVENKQDLKIVFTPLHGTATESMLRAFEVFGFKDIHLVKEQSEPDGHFPTVKFPNPEDPEALKMAVELAEKIGADLTLATDPDCDRLGVVFKNRQSQSTFLNGNQIGTLLTDYVLRQLKAKNEMPANPLAVKTIVTTELQAKVAEKYGVPTTDTLTGFKWICGLIEAYESGAKKPYREYVCGGEESFGFLAGHFVRDKDGLSACCLAAEMCAYYKSQDLFLDEALDEIYLEQGLYMESLITFTKPGKSGSEEIAALMDKLRNDPPATFADSRVVCMWDIKTQKEFLFENTKLKFSKDLDLPSSNVLQFFMQDGNKISVRPSGTEPKIKFYFSVNAAVESREELVEKKAELAARLKSYEKAMAAAVG